MEAKTVLEVMNAYAADASCESALHCWNGAERSYFPVSYHELSTRAFAFGAGLLDRLSARADSVEDGGWARR